MKIITYQEAEKILGGRVDRRNKYYYEDSKDATEMFGGGPVYTYGEWTTSCSGCFEGGEYMGLAHHYKYDNKRKCHIGSGCRECGHTGKRKDGWYSAVDLTTKGD